MELPITAIIPEIKLLISPFGLISPGNSKIPSPAIVYSLKPDQPRYAPPRAEAMQLMMNGFFRGRVIP